MSMLSFDTRTTISGSNVAVNTWHVMAGGQPTTAEVNALMVPFKTFWDAIVASRAVGSTNVTGTRVLYWLESWWTKPTFDANGKKLTDGKFNSPPIILGATPTTSIAGTGGAQIPPQLATVISWRSNVAGRTGRGRTYIGNLGGSAMTGNTVFSSSVTAINNAAAALITAVANINFAAGGNTRLAIWSPTTGVAREILTGSSDATFDTLRSRVK